ncbi:hypothetical protein ACEYYB_02580 [Paracoccus sp. p4-l81]|uniref:hypothetical protein n=1 Tax=unclassified Paracoccus (in: a-proteobacteria) TaxID=2688777 RepID=UPI0035B73362
MDSISTLASVVSALAAIAVPVILLYWAPRLAQADRRKTRDQIQTELTEAIAALQAEIAKVRDGFSVKGHGIELDQAACVRLEQDSNRLARDLDLILRAFAQTMAEHGRDSLRQTARTIRADHLLNDLQDWRSQELRDWLRNCDRKLTQASAHRHFQLMSEKADEVVQALR